MTLKSNLSFPAFISAVSRSIARLLAVQMKLGSVHRHT